MARIQTETENETRCGSCAARERNPSASSQVSTAEDARFRTREGLPPTRFPTMLAGVHQGSPLSVTWADRNGWVSADTPRTQTNETTFETSRNLQAAASSADLILRRARFRYSHPHSEPRGLTALASAEPAVIIAGCAGGACTVRLKVGRRLLRGGRAAGQRGAVPATGPAQRPVHSRRPGGPAAVGAGAPGRAARRVAGVVDRFPRAVFAGRGCRSPAPISVAATTRAAG
jgi:hypothetical protein